MANPDKREAQPHLRDLFRVGERFTIQVPDSKTGKIVDVQLWIRNPNADHQQEAIRKASADAARMRLQLKDQGSDDHMSLVASIDEMESREQLEEFLLATTDSEVREQAYNEVLYGDVGSNWSEEEKNGQEGLNYLAILSGYLDRRNEIEAHNENLPPEERIRLEEDEELQRLQTIYDLFQAEVEERAAELKRAKALDFQRQDEEQLRQQIMKLTMDLLVRTKWLEVYNAWMLFYAIRYHDDQKRLYFREPAEIAELPPSVQAQLSEFYTEVSRAGSDLKGSSSPAISSGLSEQPAASEGGSQISSLKE